MKIPLSWLRDYVDVPVPTAELAESLGMRGFEVASIDSIEAREPSAEGPDSVLDLEITANRPDCLSITGIAREVATSFGLDLRLPETTSVPPADTGPEASLEVSLEDAERCPRYAARVVEVTIEPSPAWLARRLEAADVRPINNVVDVTNYVLLELGHPTHAFDLERLAGRSLRIRGAAAGERIRTLDGQDRVLDDRMLVIADADRAQAVAGVMGGALSEVGSGTRLVALESAYFQPASVRRTSKRLGLSTDASYRFERGADVSAPVQALDRGCGLLAEIGAGRPIGPTIDRYPAPRAPGRVGLRHARIEHVLGQRIEAAFVEAVLARLGFGVAPREPGVWEVTVPTRRVDVTREIDLIEEVARHHGYDRLPATFPSLRVASPSPDPRIARDRSARRLATALGFSEAVTFSFIEADLAQAFAGPGGAVVAVGNPLSGQFTVMRPSLLPGVLTSLAHNRRREQRQVSLFEVATRFSTRGERRALALAWTGAAVAEHWSAKPRAVDLFDMLGAVDLIAERLGAPLAYAPTSRPFLVEGRAAAAHVRDAEGPLAGVVGQLAPDLLSRLGLADADEIYVAELDLDVLAHHAVDRDDVIVTPLARHPSIVRDLSIVIEERLPASTVRGTIRASAPATLVELSEFDRYTGKGIPAGSVSLSLRLTFRAPDRTLTDHEVQRAIDGIVAGLGAAHGASIR